MIDSRVSGFPGGNDNVVMGGVRPPETTGRQIVVFADSDDDTAIDLSVAGIANVADSRDFSDGNIAADVLQSADATVFAELGIAVVAADVAQVACAVSANVAWVASATSEVPCPLVCIRWSARSDTPSR